MKRIIAILNSACIYKIIQMNKCDNISDKYNSAVLVIFFFSFMCKSRVKIILIFITNLFPIVHVASTFIITKRFKNRKIVFFLIFWRAINSRVFCLENYSKIITNENDFLSLH